MRNHGFARMLALMALMVAALAPIAASAQETTSYTSQLSGQVVETSGGWTIDTGEAFIVDGSEMVPLYGSYDGMIVAWLPTGTDLVMARDIFLDEFSSVFDSFHQIDRGAYGNVSYSLDITSSEGIEFGVFSLFLGERESGFVEYYLYFGPVLYFEPGMTSAKANVTIGGAPVFDGVDPAGLQSILSDNAGISGAATTEPDTNVVAEQPVNESETTEPEPTQAPETDEDGGAAYLDSIQGEIDYLQNSIDDFYENLSSIETNAAAIDEMNRIGAEWTTYPERAAGIAAPDRLLPFDAGYRDLATDVETLGNNWSAVISALQSGDDAAYEAAFDTFATQYDNVQAGVINLQVALDIQTSLEATTGPGEQVETPAPTAEAPEPTQEVATGGDAEGDAYVASIQAEMEYLQGTLDAFIIAFVGIQGESPDAAVEEINRIAGEWLGYPDRAAGIVAPPGYEDIDASYRTLVGNVEALAQSWFAFVDQIQAGGDTEQQSALFLEIMGTVQEQVDLLNADLDSATSSETTTVQPTEVPATEVAQSDPNGEENSQASSTTGNRPEITQEREDDLVNETETGQRGQQSVNQADFESLGLVEEGLYVSPQHDIEVTWNEDWTFGSDLTDPIISDPSDGYDSIVLVSASQPVGIFSVEIVPSDGSSPEEYAEYWASDTYLVEMDAEVVLFDTNRAGSAAVTTREHLDDGTSILVLREVICGDSQCQAFVVSYVLASEADFADVYRNARGAVEADGQRTISVFSNRDIANVIGE